MKYLTSITLCMLLVGCAKGQLDVLDKNGKVIGRCSANFDFHWYGAQDSVNYILYLCAKGHIDKGRTISNPSIIERDYTLPEAPSHTGWNKVLAKRAFSQGGISEQQLGYVLAYVEHRYWMKIKKLEEQLAAEKITHLQYKRLAGEAKLEFEGE